jgi:hypothetical protein
MLSDDIVFYGVAHQRCQERPLTWRSKASQFPIREVAQPGRKFQAEHVEQCEDVIRDAPVSV